MRDTGGVRFGESIRGRQITMICSVRVQVGYKILLTKSKINRYREQFITTYTSHAAAWHLHNFFFFWGGVHRISIVISHLRENQLCLRLRTNTKTQRTACRRWQAPAWLGGTWYYTTNDVSPFYCCFTSFSHRFYFNRLFSCTFRQWNFPQLPSFMWITIFKNLNEISIVICCFLETVLLLSYVIYFTLNNPLLRGGLLSPKLIKNNLLWSHFN